MSQLTEQTNVAELALARLLTQDKGKTNWEGLIRGYVAGFQTLEAALGDVRDGLDPSVAVGDLLTKLGKRVGQARASRPDDLMRLFVLARAALNRSRGHPENVYTVARALLSSSYTLDLDRPLPRRRGIDRDWRRCSI